MPGDYPEKGNVNNKEKSPESLKFSFKPNFFLLYFKQGELKTEYFSQLLFR
jgi:hypothetical protein